MISKYTEQKCIIAMAISNNLNSMDLYKIYEESKSLDKVLEVVKRASHYKTSILRMWDAIKNPKIVVEEGASKIVKLNK